MLLLKFGKCSNTGQLSSIISEINVFSLGHVSLITKFHVLKNSIFIY